MPLCLATSGSVRFAGLDLFSLGSRELRRLRRVARGGPVGEVEHRHHRLHRVVGHHVHGAQDRAVDLEVLRWSAMRGALASSDALIEEIVQALAENGHLAGARGDFTRIFGAAAWALVCRAAARSGVRPAALVPHLRR